MHEGQISGDRLRGLDGLAARRDCALWCGAGNRPMRPPTDDDLLAELGRLRETEQSGLRLRSEVLRAVHEFAAEPPIPVWPREPVRAIYVDDSHADRELMRRACARSSLEWKMRAVEGYDRACRVLAELDGAVDLLIVDYKLTDGRTGLDVVEFAHRRCDAGPPPVIMLTSHPFKRLREDQRMRWVSQTLPKETGFEAAALDGAACTALAHGEYVRRRLELLRKVCELAGAEPSDLV